MGSAFRQKTTVERAVELVEAGMGRDFQLIEYQLMQEGFEDAAEVINDPEIQAVLTDLHDQAIHSPQYLNTAH